jgi:hypothetical protein
MQGGRRAIKADSTSVFKGPQNYLKTAGDCPDFAESSEPNGTVPLLPAVLR